MDKKIKGYDDGGIVDDYIKNQFAPPALQAPVTPSSFDVADMGPNLDATLKSPLPKAAPAPMSTADLPAPAEPLPMPEPATPTGAPAPKTVPNARVVSSHPGLNEDEIAQYLKSQRGQVDKYGPDAEQAVMDDIRKKYHSPGNIAALGAGALADGIMQGVARAGSSNYQGKIQESEQNEANNRLQLAEHQGDQNLKDLAAKQGLDAMDPNSPMGKAMLQTWGPLMDKMGIPEDQRAKMIPSLLSSVVPEEVKLKEAQARIEAMKDQRNMMMGMRQDQFDSRQWERLTDKVNSLNAGSRKALGIAANNNMRADRSLSMMSDPAIVKSPQQVINIIQDTNGIFKGGTPDEIALRYAQYPTLKADIAKATQYLSGHPEPGATAQLLDQLKKTIMDLKGVDNKVINDNLGVEAVGFRNLIQKDPGRWQDMMGAVQNTTTSPGQKGGLTPGASEAPYGDVVERNGKTYRWSPETGKYHPE